jgi:hypothetical protein
MSDTMTPLDTARRRVQDLMFQAETTPYGYCMLQAAVWAAEHAETVGDESDTRRLADVLKRALLSATERDDQKAIELHAADLLAVQSDLADLGDDYHAEKLNGLVGALPAHIVELGKARSAVRRDRR